MDEMQPKPAPSLKEQLGETEYNARMEAKLREYHFLITRSSAEHLLQMEMGGPVLRALTLRQALAAPLPSLVRARVERVFPPKLFDKNGQGARLQRVSLSDQSGPATLVLYDRACESIDREVLLGDMVEASPVLSRGEELHLAPGGAIRQVQKGPREKIIPAGGDKPASIGNFEGLVTEFGGDFPVRKNNWKQNTLMGAGASAVAAPMGLMSSFTLKDDSGASRVVLWNSPGLQGKLRVGMQAQVENGIRRGSEIHVNEAGRVVFAPQSDLERAAPAIEKIEIEEGEGIMAARVRVVAGAKTIFFSSLEDALARLGAGKLPEGVAAQTIIELKKKDWIGKPLPAKWEERG